MPGSSGERLCPICDSPLQPGSKKCGFCGTDLSIFETESEKREPAKPAASPPPQKPSMDARVREVLSAPPKPEPAPEPATQPPPKEAPVKTAASLPVEPESVVEKEPEPVTEPPEAAEPPQTAPAAEVHEYFECPECGSKVDVNASSCPGCGVMFADEGAEMFQCPACNTLVNIDSKSCPGCGAVFVESESEATTEDAAPAEAPVQPQSEMETPVEEVSQPPAEPVQTVREEPERYVQEAAAPQPEPSDEASGKKGLGALGWFKKKKKEPESAEPPRAEPEPVVNPYTAPTPAPTPAPKPAPTRVPEPEFQRPQQPQVQQARPPPVRAGPPPSAESKDKGKELARMVAEMKPLLTLANEKDIDIAESKRLIDEAAEAGRDRQLEKALEHVNRSRGILMAKIDEHLATAIMQLKEEAGVAKTLGGDVSRALTYIREIEKAKSAGDPEAAFVYADKVSNELLPITGRYKEARNRTASLRSLVADCETLIIDTKEARAALSESSRAFAANDFDKVEMLVKQATDRLYRAIPDRINEEMHAAKAQLIEAKMRNINTTPMITILKSVRTLMKAGDYQQALREMKEFKDQMTKVM